MLCVPKKVVPLQKIKSDFGMERIYVDTSVFGGYFETEFELWTKPFIEKFVIGEHWWCVNFQLSVVLY